MGSWMDSIFVIFEKGCKIFKFQKNLNDFFLLFCLTWMSVRSGSGSHPKHHQLSPIASVHDDFSSAGAGVNSDITRIERKPSAPSSEVFKHFFWKIFLWFLGNWGKIWLPNMFWRTNFSSTDMRACFLCILLLEVRSPGNGEIKINCEN